MQMEEQESVLLLGRTSSDYLSLRVRRRSNPESQDYWDGNWLNARVEVSVGGFRGAYRANLRAEEFLVFRDGPAWYW